MTCITYICEDCLTWHHIECVHMGDDMYHVHMHHNSCTWACFECGLPNKFILVHNLCVSNSFQLLADLVADSSIIPTIPVSSRGPQCTSSSMKHRNTHDKTILCKQRSWCIPLKIINLNFQSLAIRDPSDKLS